VKAERNITHPPSGLMRVCIECVASGSQLDLGTDGALFVGFTAATGGLHEAHDVGDIRIRTPPAAP